MKQLLFILIFFIFISNSFAEMKVLEKETISISTSISIVCINGYEFLITQTVYGVSVVQIYQRSDNTYHPQPKKCDCRK